MNSFIELSDFVNDIRPAKPVSFNHFLETYKVRVGKNIIPLKSYSEKKSIRTENLMLLFHDITNIESYLERFYNNGVKVLGKANFTKTNANEFKYSEKGIMILADGKEMMCARKYIYKPSPTGFEVYFFENPKELFQNVILKKEKNGSLSAKATHFCLLNLFYFQK